MTDLFEGLSVEQPGREPVDDDLYVSQTTVSNALLCGGRILYRGADGYNYSPSEAMSFGTMVHGMCEADLALLGTPVCGNWSPEGVEDMWVSGLLNERDGSFDLHSLASRQRIDKSVEEALLANARWHEQVVPVLDLAPGEEMMVEQRVTKQLGTLPDGRAVWFGGTADLVLPRREEIVDWKTAGRGWDASKADFIPQATYYSWLYGIYNHTYWVWNRRAKDWTAFSTSRTEEQVDAALRVAWQVARQMADGTLTATPLQDTFGKVSRGWHCSAKFCGAWDICGFKYLPDNVYEEQRINLKVGWE